jgi:NodT family efflux transporter outer membrane factor (OMF) lipoprotein
MPTKHTMNPPFKLPTWVIRLLANVIRMTLCAASLMLTSCAVGPDYRRPDVVVPATYKELDLWQPARPQDAVPRGTWWQVFGDPLLDDLMNQVSISNQTLAQAEARYRQARAIIQSAQANYFPVVGANLSASRSSASNRNNQTLSQNSNSNSGRNTSSTLSLDTNWELDLWGRISRNVEAERANAQASAGDLEASRLSLQAQLAQNYFALRSLDSQQQLLARTLKDYQRSVQLTQNQYDAGIIAKSNLILAQTQLKSTQAQALDLGVQRAQLEHAIAILVGKPPANLTISEAQLNAVIPTTPVALPSSLLERRPDIAAAERRVEAANAEIGVAQSAYFPKLTLSASGGAQSSVLSDLFSLPNRFWSFGPALAATLFDGGARRAQVAQATAAYDATVAAYRQTVLVSFQEVEDNLAALRILETEAAAQDEAVTLARRSVELTNNQYQSGIVSYLNVIQVQATALNNERTAVDLNNRRLAASVQLMKALGGDWIANTPPIAADK